MDDNYNVEHEENYQITLSNGDKILVPYAGFWIRLWAYLLDLFVLFSINGIILAPLYLGGNMAEWTLGIFTLVGVFATIVSFAYFTLMTKLYRKTLGKQVFGLKVYPNEGRSLSWLDVIFREVIGRYIHQSLVFTNALYLIVAFSDEKRGIHDRIGHTFVGLEPRKSRSIQS